MLALNSKISAYLCLWSAGIKGVSHQEHTSKTNKQTNKQTNNYHHQQQQDSKKVKSGLGTGEYFLKYTFSLELIKASTRKSLDENP